MDTLQLKLFISVSQTLNFTKTAGEFFMTQPTVSNYIKALEDSLGVTLLKRDSRKVSLTPEGQEFAGYAERLLALEKDAETRLRNMSKGRRGYIRIAMLSSTAELFSECLTRYFREYSGVSVDVDIKEGAEMSRAMTQRACDIYFANRYMLPGSGDIEYIVTGTHQLRLFAHRDIAGKIDINDWSTLKNYHFVSVPETDFTLSGQIEKLCLNRGIVPDIINYYSRADALLLAVNTGIGMAILPPGLTYFYSFPNVVSMEIEGGDATINTVIAWHNDGLSADALNFLGLIPRK